MSVRWAESNPYIYFCTRWEGQLRLVSVIPWRQEHLYKVRRSAQASICNTVTPRASVCANLFKHCPSICITAPSRNTLVSQTRQSVQSDCDARISSNTNRTEKPEAARKPKLSWVCFSSDYAEPISRLFAGSLELQTVVTVSRVLGRFIQEKVHTTKGYLVTR